MIELTFWNFHERNYLEKNYCLYVMKNGFGGVLYVGISTVDIWSRWFAWGGHMTWDRNVIYGESSIGEKIEKHIPDSLSWKIQLWTLEDCFEFCGKELPSTGDHDQALRDIERHMIKKLSPALNVTYNRNPGKDTTPKSQKEKDWEKYVNQAYDEIFNKRS